MLKTQIHLNTSRTFGCISHLLMQKKVILTNILMRFTYITFDIKILHMNPSHMQNPLFILDELKANNPWNLSDVRTKQVYWMFMILEIISCRIIRGWAQDGLMPIVTSNCTWVQVFGSSYESAKIVSALMKIGYSLLLELPKMYFPHKQKYLNYLYKSLFNYMNYFKINFNLPNFFFLITQNFIIFLVMITQILLNCMVMITQKCGFFPCGRSFEKLWMTFFVEVNC